MPSFIGDKAIDRSPCGTGTSASIGAMFCSKRLVKNQGDDFIHEKALSGCKIHTGRKSKKSLKLTATCINPSIEGVGKSVMATIRHFGRMMIHMCIGS